jgi:cysteine/O-acetylserine efflux protein
LFALLLAFIGFIFTLCWSAFGSAFRLLFSRHTKSVNTIMALLLVYCAATLFGY